MLHQLENTGCSLNLNPWKIIIFNTCLKKVEFSTKNREKPENLINFLRKIVENPKLFDFFYDL